MLQLQPVIPITVVSGAGWKGPTGKAMAIGWVDRGADHHMIWIVFMDSTGECWQVENPNVRARPNITWGRPLNFVYPPVDTGPELR